MSKLDKLTPEQIKKLAEKAKAKAEAAVKDHKIVRK